MERMSRRSSLYLLVLAFFFYGLQLDAATVNKDLEGIKRKIETERQGINQVRKREGSGSPGTWQDRKRFGKEDQGSECSKL